MKLKDKVAIVTGAGAGMGKSVAIRYAMEGAKVLLADFDEAAAKETESVIKNAGGVSKAVKVNVSNEDAVKDMVATCVSEFGRIDVLYNNVARMHKMDRRVHELSSAIWLELVEVNLNSAFYCAKYVITEMLKTGGGSLIFVGSPTAIVACASNDAAYSSTKSGVHALARVIAGAYGTDNIRANIVIPGTMDTPMIKDIIADNKVKKDLEAAAMLGRLGKPSDVDGLAVFLASDESAYCTGGYFTVDGGLTAL